MDSLPVSNLFVEQTWSKVLPEKYIIPSLTFKLTKQDIEFLTDDDTNPDETAFSQYQSIKDALNALKGKVFAKFANRSAKDCSLFERKVTSVRGLIMLVKMSQFLTEGLCDEEDHAELVLRQYDELFEKEFDQFRVYSIQGRLVGICQKNPSYFQGTITKNQIQKITEIHALILEQISKLQLSPLKKKVQFVFDLYCSPNGHIAYLFSIDPFHIHGLSLFTEEQLRSHYEKQKEKPRIQMVEEERQLKTFDLSSYKSGAELMNLQNAKKWMEFMEGKEEQEE